MSDGIGGFLARESAVGGAGVPAGDLLVATGRGALDLVLEATGATKVWVPDWHCDSLTEPVRRRGLSLDTYAVDERLGPTQAPAPGPGELLVVLDAFGLHGDHVRRLGESHGSAVVIDRTQSAFGDAVSGCWSPSACWSFDSLRKFIGVAEGARLTGPVGWVPPSLPRPRALDESYLDLRAAGRRREAYDRYVVHEEALGGPARAPVEGVADVLARLDVEAIAAVRRRNWTHLHGALAALGRLSLPEQHPGVPFAFPLLLEEPPDREVLVDHEVFVPTLWPERRRDPIGAVVDRLLPLPIDQRYGARAMDRVVEAVHRAIR